MTDPNRASRSTSIAEESFFDLLDETLRSLERPARGQFLCRFFKVFASIEISDSRAADLWDRIRARHRELSSGGPVSLKAVVVDVMQDLDLLQVPVLVEYRELRRLEVNAGTDALTGLYNRRLFEEHFNKESSRAQRSGGQLALAILDLHRFKEVNDRYGHPAGDRALRLVSDAARDTLRSSDFTFRIGGDEFAVLLPQCDHERGVALSKRLRQRYADLVQGLAPGVPLALDYGVAVLPQDGQRPEELNRVADRRLYEMKNSGTNDVPVPSSARTLPITPARPAAAPPSPGSDKRKWERIPLAGTSAHAMWNDLEPARVPVVDLSYGGVALMVPDPDVFPVEFPAVLHVPTQLPVKVVLHKAYTHPAGESGTRVGFAFVSKV